MSSKGIICGGRGGGSLNESAGSLLIAGSRLIDGSRLILRDARSCAVVRHRTLVACCLIAGFVLSFKLSLLFFLDLGCTRFLSALGSAGREDYRY